MVASGGKSASSKLLVLRVRSQLCAVPLESVLETCRPLPTDPIPDAPPFVSGLTLIRARPTPVVDARRLLGPASDGAPGRYVTLKLGAQAERFVTLAVDAVVGVRDVTSQRLEQLPALLRGEQTLVRALGTLDSELLLLLEHAYLLPDALWAELERRGAAV